MDLLYCIVSRVCVCGSVCLVSLFSFFFRTTYYIYHLLYEKWIPT